MRTKRETVPVTEKKVSRVEIIRETFKVKTKGKEVDRETVKESRVRQMAGPFELMMNKETRKKADIREKEREKKKKMRKENRDRKLSKERTESRVSLMVDKIRGKSEVNPKRKIENEEIGKEWGERGKRAKITEEVKHRPTTPIWGGGAREKIIGGKIPKIEEPITGKKESMKVGGNSTRSPLLKARLLTTINPFSAPKGFWGFKALWTENLGQQWGRRRVERRRRAPMASTSAHVFTGQSYAPRVLSARWQLEP